MGLSYCLRCKRNRGFSRIIVFGHCNIFVQLMQCVFVCILSAMVFFTKCFSFAVEVPSNKVRVVIVLTKNVVKIISLVL